MCKTILIINEEQNTNSFLKNLISAENPEMNVISVNSGKAGLEWLTENNSSITFIGSALSDMDSADVCETLKQTNKTQFTPVVFLISDSMSPDFQKRAAMAGADAFLKVPFNETEVYVLLKTMVKIKMGADLKEKEKTELEKNNKNAAKLQTEKKNHIQIEKALAESEERYRLLVENQNDLVVKFDKNQNMVYVNPNYCKSFGISEEEIIGQKFFPLIHPEDLETAKKSIEELAFPPNKSYHEERDKTVNGWRWFGWSKKAILNKKGEIVEVIAVGRDISDRYEIEQKLLENEKSFRELNATKDKFFSIIAHDLRGPFNAILGFSELIAEKCEKNDFRDVCMMSKLLHSSAKHSFELLTNLLEWSRTQRGKKQFEPKEIQLNSLLETEIELVSLAAKEKNITIKSDCRETTVYADYNMLQTVLRNLISNAIKYSFKGGEINIAVEKKEEKIIISVTDNGVGIKSEKQSNLFNIGDMESTPGTYNEKGTGLGLILCKDFIEKHKGKIWVESEDGLGTTFYFSLPIQP